MRKFWEKLKEKKPKPHMKLGYLPGSLSVISLPFFFILQISSDLPNNRKDEKKKAVIFQRYFFSSLAFPLFHHHIHHHYLGTFPLNRDKNKNTTHCHSDNTQPWPSIPTLGPSGSQAALNSPLPCSTPVTMNQNDPRSLGVLNLQPLGLRSQWGPCSPWS